MAAGYGLCDATSFNLTCTLCNAKNSFELGRTFGILADFAIKVNRMTGWDIMFSYTSIVEAKIFMVRCPACITLFSGLSDKYAI